MEQPLPLSVHRYLLDLGGVMVAERALGGLNIDRALAGMTHHPHFGITTIVPALPIPELSASIQRHNISLRVKSWYLVGSFYHRA
jgi:hypothetical protein